MILISFVILIIIGIGIYIKATNKDENINNRNNNPNIFSQTQGIQTVLTLDDELKSDTIWCGTFQLIWNDLKNDLAKQDIIFYNNPDLQVVKNLNKETFKTSDISEKYYYKKIGISSIKLKKEIEKGIKDKFNETSNILNDFNWDYDNDGLEKYFLYVMLKKEFQFKKEFEELNNGKFGKYDNVKYFGIVYSEERSIRNQVKILYYNSKDDFAIKLKTKQEDEVILCKNPKGNTFNKVFENIKTAETKFKGNKSLEEGERLKIPNIKLNEKNEIEEVENQSFYFSNKRSYHIDKAIQTIEFELDRKGGKIKSEAGMMVDAESIAIEPDEKREFLIDDTFAIFLIEENKDVPYFAGIISDITKFQ